MKKAAGSKKASTGKTPEGDADPKVTSIQDMYLSPKRQCTAHSKHTGQQCGRYAMRGLRVCVVHGGATRQAKAKAAQRIQEASGYAADLLVELMANPDIDVKTRTQIAQDLLNRSGVSEKHILQIGAERPKSFEDWVGETIIDVLVDDDDPNVIDAEVIEDDTAPLVRREPDVQNNRDRAVFAEVERAARGRAMAQSGGTDRAELIRAEREALGLAGGSRTPAPPRRGGRSDDVQAMNAQQDAEDAELERVKAAERRRNHERQGSRRARVTDATMSQRRRGER